MRCRSIPATSSSSGLWITDEVLSEAFNRFVRVSNANLYHAKRFRSHAPGPLEARRRATRRKMGVATVASGSTPPPFDMGALLGLGVKPGANMEKGMRWEGPQLPASPPSWQVWDPKWRRKPNSKHVEEERLAQFLEVPKDPIETSRAGFEELLSARQDMAMLKTRDIEPLLAYLQSAENHPDARLTGRLLIWLQERQASGQSLLAFVNVVSEKLALGTITEGEMDVITQKLSKRQASYDLAVSLAASLPRTWAQEILARQTRRILDSEDATTRLETLRKWLACIDGSPLMKERHYCLDSRWTDVYAEISKHFKPSDLAEHFSTLPHHAVSWIILRHWVPLLASPSTSPTPDFVDLYASRRLRHYDGTMELPPHGLLEGDLKRLHQASRDESDPDKARSPLANLIQVLAERKLPHTAILEEVLAIYRQGGPPKTLRNIFLDIFDRPTMGVSTPLATSLAKHFMASGEIEHARQIFEAVPTIPLSACFDLPLYLIEKRALPSWVVFIMLTRLTPQDTLGAEERTEHGSSLNQEHVDLVHLVAHACAKSPHISPRVAFRRVWECFRFLRDRTAPLDILMSRALVRAGISRYLAEGIRPSAKQVAYILDIVRKIEGLDIAKTLDSEIYRLGQRLWREKPGDSPPRWNQATVERDEADVRNYGEVRHRMESAKGWTTGRTRSMGRTIAKAERAREMHGFDANGSVATPQAMGYTLSAESDMALAGMNEALSTVEQIPPLHKPASPQATGVDVDATMARVAETFHSDQEATGVSDAEASRQGDDVQLDGHVNHTLECLGEQAPPSPEAQKVDVESPHLAHDTSSVPYIPPEDVPTTSSNSSSSPAASNGNKIEVLDKTELWSIAPRIASLGGDYNSFLIKEDRHQDVYIPIRNNDPQDQADVASITQSAVESSQTPAEPSFQSILDLLARTGPHSPQPSASQTAHGVESETATEYSGDPFDEESCLDTAGDPDVAPLGENATPTAQWPESDHNQSNAPAQPIDQLFRKKKARLSFLHAQQKTRAPVPAGGRYMGRARFRRGLAGLGAWK